MKWNSFCHDTNKIDLTKTLILRALRICSPSLLKLKLDFIKSVILVNGYPLEVTQLTIRAVQLQQQKELLLGAEKFPVYLKLPSIGSFLSGLELLQKAVNSGYRNARAVVILKF